MIKIDIDKWDDIPEYCEKVANNLADGLEDIVNKDILEAKYIRVHQSSNYINPNQLVYTICFEPQPGVNPSHITADEIERIACELYCRDEVIGGVSYDGLYIEVLD